MKSLVSFFLFIKGIVFPFQSLVSTVLLVASLEVVVSLELSVLLVSLELSVLLVTLVLLQCCQGMKLIQLREID